MPNPIVKGESADLFDQVTGEHIGHLDRNGREQRGFNVSQANQLRALSNASAAPSNAIDIFSPGNGVTPTVAVAGTGWSLTSQGFVQYRGEQWYEVVITGTNGGIGQVDFIVNGIRPFAADSLHLEYMAEHAEGGTLNVNLSTVDGNFSSAIGVFTNNKGMFAPNQGDPGYHSGNNAVGWCKAGIAVQGASFTISANEPVIGKPWQALRFRRTGITSKTGTVVTRLRAITAGTNRRKGRLCVIADDGYHSWFRLGAPMLARYGIPSTASIIASGVDVNTTTVNGNATLAELKNYVAAGNACVAHGPNQTADNLFDGPFAGGDELNAARIADMNVSRDFLLQHGLCDDRGAKCYVWPQGTYSQGGGEVSLLDAAYEAGYRLGRAATAYTTLFPQISAMSERCHTKLILPLIGHTYAGTTNSAGNAAETTNIANVAAYIASVADSGVDAFLMLHRVVNRGAATAGSIEIETDRLASLCNSIKTLVDAGTLECVTMPQLLEG